MLVRVSSGSYLSKNLEVHGPCLAVGLFALLLEHLERPLDVFRRLLHVCGQLNVPTGKRKQGLTWCEDKTVYKLVLLKVFEIELASFLIFALLSKVRHVCFLQRR